MTSAAVPASTDVAPVMAAPEDPPLETDEEGADAVTTAAKLAEEAAAALKAAEEAAAAKAKVEKAQAQAAAARAAAEKAAGPAEPCGEYRPNLQAKFTNGAPDCQCGFARDLHSKAALGEEEEAAPEDTGPTAAEVAALKEKREAGLGCAQAREAGCSCLLVKEAGYSVKEAFEAGYPCQDAEDAGFDWKEAKKAGYKCIEKNPYGPPWHFHADKCIKC
eukprot:Transcript_28551.p2 GENE.Transcript_28551~~Transcript_28551.p2  ORF type:complete len:219 (-),score=94.78 Transcript_28551:98-754(-)